MFLIFDMHDLHGALFLKARSLFVQLFALLPPTVTATFTTVYTSLYLYIYYIYMLYYTK